MKEKYLKAYVETFIWLLIIRNCAVIEDNILIKVIIIMTYRLLLNLIYSVLSNKR